MFLILRFDAVINRVPRAVLTTVRIGQVSVGNISLGDLFLLISIPGGHRVFTLGFGFVHLFDLGRDGVLEDGLDLLVHLGDNLCLRCGQRICVTQARWLTLLVGLVNGHF